MTKAELVSRVADKAGLTKREAAAAVEAVVEVVGASLRSAQRVQLHGLGVFEVVRRAARVGRNPRTGQRAEVPARRAVRFKPARSLRGAVA